MRLFTQALTGISLVAIASFGGAWVAREAIVQPHVRELQAQADRQDLRRVLLAIDSKQQQLVALAYDAALRRTPPVPAVETCIALNINHFMTVAADGLSLQSLKLDPQQGAFVPDGQTYAELQPYLAQLRRKIQGPVFTSGWMLSPRGPLLYALAATPRRSVLFASTVNGEFIQDLEDATQLKLSLTPLPADFAAPAATATAIRNIRRDHRNRLRWIINDTLGHPAALLTVDEPTRATVDKLASAPLLVALLIGIAGGILLLLLVERVLILPIRSLVRHLVRVRELGDYSLRLRLPSGNEVGRLNEELNALVEQVQTQQLQLIAQSRDLRTLSYQDGLTALANRRRFDQALTDNWATAQRQHQPLALIMLDVDYFKAYNDHYGHQKGDDVLRHLARIISQVVVRSSDLASRYGGEEFAILLPNTSEGGALHLANQLQERLQAADIRHEYSHICQRLTLSIGIASLIPDGDLVPRDLLHRADEALYVAKANGRNRIEVAAEQS